MRGTDKIGADHLGRSAAVYIRQSTDFQMRHNVYSQERQYQLADLGVELGWQRERIDVIDEDLGHSASTGSDRDGFTRLRRGVAEGRMRSHPLRRGISTGSEQPGVVPPARPLRDLRYPPDRTWCDL